jgi:hypothetical protein
MARDEYSGVTPGIGRVTLPIPALVGTSAFQPVSSLSADVLTL